MIPHLDAGHARPNLIDDRRYLVAGDHRRLGERMPSGEHVKLGAANAKMGQPQPNLTLTERWRVDLLLAAAHLAYFRKIHLGNNSHSLLHSQV